jgi:tetratricopeptide (TPR) repeat protein
LGEALEHHQARRHAEATALYIRVLEDDPDEPTALYLLGLLSFETGKVDIAFGLLDRVVALRPDHAQARVTLANLRHWQGDYAAAIEGFKAVIERQPNHLIAQVGLAKALRDAGELDAAAAAARAALDIDPDCASAYDALAGVFQAQGRAERAIEAYEQAIALDPRMSSAQIGLALVLLSEDRSFEAALGAADAALALDPTMADGWFARGFALAKLQRLPEGLEALKQAVALNPEHALAHLNLGNLYGELEKGEEAIAHLREAISLEPTLKEAHASLGSLYLLTGQKAEAEQYSWLALAIDPAMVVPHQNLAALLDERGETAAAREHRDAAYTRQNVFVDVAPRPRRRVLILSTAESGNVPFRYLLPRERYTRINWVIEYAGADQAASLPPYDLVFNAVGDPDLAGPTEAPTARFLETCDVPVFNDPASVRRTARNMIPDLLSGIADVTAPRTLRVSSDVVAGGGLGAAVARGGFMAPVLIRPIGSHGGQGLIRVDDAGAIGEAHLSPGRDAYVTAFRDYRSADGAWRKYRMIFVDRRPYPYHLAISDNWMVHHGTADMTKRPDRMAEELRFLEDPESAIGARALAAIAAVGQRLDLDYAGADFAVLPDGSVLVFEANANMLVHPEEADSPLAPKNPHVRRILDAFETMIASD